MPDASPSPPSRERRALAIAAIVIVLLAAVVVRIGPLENVSMWWDELVHVQTASQDGFAEVVSSVKLGIPPGFGNAGAVPLDYLLLHAWLRTTPEPSPDGIEMRYRFPALVWSLLTVLGAWVYVRRFWDTGLALLVATILALSVSHALYAAEARSYSLFGMMTIANLFAFSSLVLEPQRATRWVIYTTVGLLYFATGFPSLLVMAPQYLLLLGLLVQDVTRLPRRPTRAELARLALPLASGAAVLAAVALYLQGTYLGVRHGRTTADLRLWERLGTATTFLSDDNPVLLWAFVAGVILLPLQGWRRGRESFVIALQLVVSFVAVPVIVEIERWKEYYFHPRHAFFLLPTFALVAAGGLLLALRQLDVLRRTRWDRTRRDAAYVTMAILIVLATQVGPIVQHLQRPERRFARTKTLRDFKSLVHHLRDRVEELDPDQKYLLLAERGEPGHIANPVLAKYLEWHGLDDRVILRGVDHPREVLPAIRRECPDGCVGQRVARVQRRLKATGPFRAGRAMLELIEVAPARQSADPVGAVGFVHYWRFRGGPPRQAPGFATSTHTGMTLFEKIRSPADEGDASNEGSHRLGEGER